MDDKQSKPTKTEPDLQEVLAENQVLRAQLVEAKETLAAIQSGAVDALVIDVPEGSRIFTLEGADHAYRALIEQMGEGAVTLRADGTIHYCNRGFAQILERPLEQLMGTPALCYVSEVDHPAFAALLRQGLAGRVQGEIGFLATDGRVVPAQVGFSPLMDGTAATSVSMVVTNLTERKRAEHVKADKLIAEQATAVAESASKAKDHFLAVLSHELRNPLNPVLATASMLRDDPRFDADTREQLEVICRNAELEARLVDDLLDVTRIERGKVELDRQPIDLGTIIRRAVEVCMPDIEVRKLEFGVDLGPAPHWVDADATRLQQVFWNLIKNAIKFTPVGGCVGIRVSQSPEQSDGGPVAAPFVIVEIYDSGEGIEPEAIGRIFNAFEQAERSITRQFGGLGLGLTISKAMVEMHGGTISAHSQGKGKGATFTVKLPVANRQSPADPGNPPSPATDNWQLVSSLRILLVEDHGDTARIMRRLLEADGHQVQNAADVAMALKLADEQPFDLMLSDLGLPDGSGLDLMRTLRAKGIDLPGIALSGFGQESDIQQSRHAGFLAHIVKPVSLPKLEEAIAKVSRRV